jgi:hypothetical protein
MQSQFHARKSAKAANQNHKHNIYI